MNTKRLAKKITKIVVDHPNCSKKMEDDHESITLAIQSTLTKFTDKRYEDLLDVLEDMISHMGFLPCSLEELIPEKIWSKIQQHRNGSY